MDPDPDKWCSVNGALYDFKIFHFYPKLSDCRTGAMYISEVRQGQIVQGNVDGRELEFLLEYSTSRYDFDPVGELLQQPLMVMHTGMEGSNRLSRAIYTFTCFWTNMHASIIIITKSAFIVNFYVCALLCSSIVLHTHTHKDIIIKIASTTDCPPS